MTTQEAEPRTEKEMKTMEGTPDANAPAKSGEVSQRVELIFDIGVAGRKGVSLPRLDADAPDPRARLGEDFARKHDPALPEVSEPQAVRHYTRLSQKNFSIDTHFYPLGSCTMKYNPRACEAAAANPAFTGLHPYQSTEDSQGTLSMLSELQGYLADLTGLPHVSLAPVAGAQGEFAGMAIIRAWQIDHGGEDRDVVLVPDSAHGTNPASAALAGMKVRTVKSGPDGRVDLDSLREALDDKVAGIMLTNPNTCGVFEKDILEISKMVHDAGALLYYDGANLNAIVGLARPRDMGFDVVHLNLHKTFSTPHGGGGPGAGPIAVREDLGDYLPPGRIEGSAQDGYRLGDAPSKSIGSLHAFYGNVGVLLRAYTYIRLQGAEGLRDIAENSVLNANYLLAKLKDVYQAPFEGPCMHEFILTLKSEAREQGIKALDVSKRLIDFGIHPPTNYFPLLVPECLLIEPTENETKQTLDRFVDVMRVIRWEIDHEPERLLTAPTKVPVGRVDEVRAVKQLNVCCMPVPVEDDA